MQHNVKCHHHITPNVTITGYHLPQHPLTVSTYIIRDILEVPAFRKCSTSWVFSALFLTVTVKCPAKVFSEKKGSLIALSQFPNAFAARLCCAPHLKVGWVGNLCTQLFYKQHSKYRADTAQETVVGFWFASELRWFVPGCWWWETGRQMEAGHSGLMWETPGIIDFSAKSFFNCIENQVRNQDVDMPGNKKANWTFEREFPLCSARDHNEGKFMICTLGGFAKKCTF